MLVEVIKQYKHRKPQVALHLIMINLNLRIFQYLFKVTIKEPTTVCVKNNKECEIK